MRMRALAIVACLVVLSSGCGRQSSIVGPQFEDKAVISGISQVDYSAQKELLAKADPYVDAANAFRSGDVSFVGLGGMVIEIPGFANRADIRDSLRWKKILGTGGRDEDFERLAADYALKYNISMLNLLQSD
jgi:hypothetical protein